MKKWIIKTYRTGLISVPKRKNLAQPSRNIFLTGTLVGCISFLILVLKIRTSCMSEFRHIVIILVLSNFFYLSTKTFQRSKKLTVVKFSHWETDSKMIQCEHRASKLLPTNFGWITYSAWSFSPLFHYYLQCQPKLSNY